jgi:glucan phosphoethanolaminetransferase (alkaline phosphatase superfamily)
MNAKFSKILKGLVALIAIIAAYFFIRIVSTGDDAIVEGQGTLGIVGPLVSFSIALLIVVASVAVIFSILSLLKKPEALKKSLIGIAALAVLLAISYGVSPDTAVTDVTGQVLEGGEAGSPSRWVSTGIWYTVLLGVGAIVAIVLGGVKSIVK